MTLAVPPCHVIDFWPQVRNDLTRVTWSHATNSRKKLTRAIQDPELMMIEADVVKGSLFGQSEVQPIMAHPPENRSDLSLAEFMRMVSPARKGIKLDFKDISIVEQSLQILSSVPKEELNFPIWFNADILRGPGSSKEPVTPDVFLRLCQSYFPFFTLSLGWTTGLDPKKPLKYNSKHIEDMLQAINTIIQSDRHSWFTFAVRAALALNSLPELEQLLEKSGPNTSLTLWTAEGDTLDSSKLNDFISRLGRNRIYVDLPLT
ncbi:hypothetical protein TCAL_05318, partial [Tigriopus californicus]|eukprot:TCALIF_05318-PA protein Name:"Similar to FAM151B Protein FAM151B (Homo sapiens)" AED:0.19 eAED:0.19 QI:128/1/0.75/1/0.66/0.25/4/0/260